MIPIILRTIRDRWKMLLAMCLIGVGSQLMYISLYPSFKTSQVNYDEVFKQIPEAFMKVINMDSFQLDTVEKYLTMEMYSMFWLILTIILCLSLPGSGLTAEVERETIVQSAAQPVSRPTVYVGKWLAAVSIFTVFNFVVNVVVFPLCEIFKLSYQPSHFLAVGVIGELFAVALLSLTFAVAAFLSDKGRVYMVMGGVILVMYVINIVSSLKPAIDNLKYASLFHYFDPNKALIKGQYDSSAIFVFIGLIAVGFAVGLMRWRSRDIL